MDTTTVKNWERRGSEQEAQDRAGNVASNYDPKLDPDLEGALDYFFEKDLSDLGADDRAEALAALLRGYKGEA